MPQTKDLYDVLGVDEDARPEEIKAAYRELARKHHPDRNPDDPTAEERFKEIQKAYSVLSDEEQRKQYDAQRRFGRGGVGAGAQGGPNVGGAQGFEDAFGGRGGDVGGRGGFGDLFESFFGEGRGRRSPGRGPFGRQQQQRRQQQRPQAPTGQDLETTLQLSFREALEGGRKRVELPSGESIRLNIPKGVRDGFKIRLQGRGQRSRQPGGARGDLYVTFSVGDHPRFERTGDDLFLTTSIGVFDAVFGTEIRVPTPYGQRLKLTVPPGTQPGEKMRLTGQGVRTDDGTGDLYVEIDVDIPTDLSEQQEQVLRKAAQQANLL
jgi:molecular chaperone DnaJ/curved DNA-binding protein